MKKKLNLRDILGFYFWKEKMLFSQAKNPQGFLQVDSSRQAAQRKAKDHLKENRDSRP